MTKAKTEDALQILRRRYIGDDKRLQAELDKERISAEVARQLYDARKRAALSQQQLAELVGTTQSVISRLEDADYDGHTVKMLNRIAAALGQDLDISIVGAKIVVTTGIKTESETGELQELLDLCPTKEMLKRDWLPGWANLQELRSSLRAFLGPAPSLGAAHLRVSNASKADQVALLCWLTKAQIEAERTTVGSWNASRLKAGIRELVKLSARNDGPASAVQWLEDRGVRCVVVRHLPKTYVDGAAMLLEDRKPAIALTLRHDRLDNFWFTLLHEVGHALLHKRQLGRNPIIDQDLERPAKDRVEEEANCFANDAWVSLSQWQEFRRRARDTPTLEQISGFAESLGISPALVAGRLRHELQRWTHYGSLLGQGQPLAIIRKRCPVF